MHPKMARASTPVLQRLLRCGPLCLVTVQQGGDKVTGLVCREQEAIFKGDSLMVSHEGSSVHSAHSAPAHCAAGRSGGLQALDWQSGVRAQNAGGGRRHAPG